MMKLYKKVTMFFGDPPEEALTNEENQKIMDSIKPTSTQAQIEAARSSLWKDGFRPSRECVAAALTAAAQVGETEIEFLRRSNRELGIVANTIKDEAIERCAQVMDGFFENAHMNRAAAAAIRALNEARPIYPGDWKRFGEPQQPNPPLTAAAQAAVATPEEVYETLSRAELRSEIVKLHMRNAATIERCAQVVDELAKVEYAEYEEAGNKLCKAAAAIRVLKEE